MEQKFIREPIEQMDCDEAVNICFRLAHYASDYIKEERPAIENIKQNARDAILGDAINYLGGQYNRFFGLHTNDLYTEIDDDEEVNVTRLLNAMMDNFEKYLLEENIEESVLDHHELNNCKFGFEEEIAMIVLFDFMTYVANTLNYDIQENLDLISKKLMKAKYHNQDRVTEYMVRLQEGEAPNQILESDLEALCIAIINVEDSEILISSTNGIIGNRIQKILRKNAQKK